MRKKKIDYTKLPFEVHFKRLGVVSYEFIYTGRQPKTLHNYRAIAKSEGDAWDVTFRCDDPQGGALLYVLAGRIDEYIPDWLYLVDENDWEISSRQSFRFSVAETRLKLARAIDGECYESSGFGATFYSAHDFQPDYLVLDADGSRLVVDAVGYMLAEDDSRIEASPVVAFSKDDVDNCAVTGRDEWDIEFELAKMLED